MRKTLDQILREHPLLQTYLALGGTYYFDSRNIVLNTPGCEEETLKFGVGGGEITFRKEVLNKHISYMEEQLHSEHLHNQLVDDMYRMREESQHYREFPNE